MGSPVQIAILYPCEIASDLTHRITSVATDIVVNSIPYLEPSSVRSARGSGQTLPPEPIDAPVLGEDDWRILEASEVVVAVDLPDDLIIRASRLRWVHICGAGMDHLDVAGMEARGITLTSAAGIGAPSIAEFVFARVLQVARDLRRFDQQQADRVWRPLPAQRLAGRRMGVVGLGSIGRATARLARAFDMHVVAVRRTTTDSDPDADRMYSVDELDQMLAVCDVVVVAAPADGTTRGLFDATRIASMKPGSVLCNVARGALVDEDAVVAALRSGHLSAAILDVTRIEPTPSDSPLWDAPNCYLTPHSAVVLEDYDTLIVEHFAGNLARWLDGRPLDNQVLPRSL